MKFQFIWKNGKLDEMRVNPSAPRCCYLIESIIVVHTDKVYRILVRKYSGEFWGIIIFEISLPTTLSEDDNSRTISAPKVLTMKHMTAFGTRSQMDLLTMLRYLPMTLAALPC